MHTQNRHWRAYASKWDRIGSPLRPCLEDVENFRKALGENPENCLLLGVTPELANLASRLTAVDNSADMIKSLWLNNQRNAVHGNWLSLPFDAGSFDNVIGDGCLVLLSYPIQFETLFQQVTRVLRPGGRFILRIFVNLTQAESREHVCNMAMEGKIKGFHAFKWRLMMSIAAESPNYNFNIVDAYTTFNHLLPDRELLSANTGWPMQDIETIDFYHGSDARYSYPPLSQVRKTIPPQFKEVEIKQGTYELAERCPILVLERRG